MLKSHLKIGSLFGIKIGLHYSWFLIAFLIVFTFAGNFKTQFPQLTGVQTGLLGVSAALIFFTSLLLHELSHSLVAKSRGIPVREITLFALGGVSQMEGETVRAKDEFTMAAAGPFASLLIGLFLLLTARFVGGPVPTPAKTLLSLLGYLNIGLAVFNMVPGYPLDGGRILRAALWWKSGDMDAATRSAAQVGQAVGFVFILLGIAGFFSGQGFGGLWIAFIGWFLVQAASSSYIQVGIKEALAGARVSDIMTRDCPTVDRNTNLQELVDSHLLRTGRRCFLVADDGGVAGLVTPKEIAEVNRSLWPLTTVDRVMRSIEDLRTVTPDEPLANALEMLGREDINQLPVVENGRLLGLLSRADVINYLRTAMELRGSQLKM